MSDPSENIIDASRVAMKMKRNKEIISLITRQTNYDEEKAKERLVFWKNNYLDVIKEYMNPKYIKENKKKGRDNIKNQIGIHYRLKRKEPKFTKNNILNSTFNLK